jgi:hypothetical protein
MSLEVMEADLLLTVDAVLWTARWPDTRFVQPLLARLSV